MFDFIKTTGVAAVLALAPLAASAAIVTIEDGDIIKPVNPDDVYVYENLLQGSGAGGMAMFEFIADQPLNAFAGESILEFNGSIADPSLTWYYGATTIAGTVTATAFGYELSANTMFTAPDALEQKLVVAWGAYTGPVQISLQVSSEPATVPVPAAGLLLLSALGGAVALRRKS